MQGYVRTLCSVRYTAIAHRFWYSTMAVVLGLATRDGGENRSQYDECLKVDLYTYYEVYKLICPGDDLYTY